MPVKRPFSSINVPPPLVRQTGFAVSGDDECDGEGSLHDACEWVVQVANGLVDASSQFDGLEAASTGSDSTG